MTPLSRPGRILMAVAAPLRSAPRAMSSRTLRLSLAVMALALAAAPLVAAKKAAKKKGARSPAAAGAWAKTHGLYARFDTTMGRFVCLLLEKQSPQTVDNFTGLAVGEKEWVDPKSGEYRKARFYDGLTFHRVVPDYVIQGGDPKGDSTGGPGFEFEDEVNGLKFDQPGRLAMANSGPDTNGSQFFITTGPQPQLDDRALSGGRRSHYTIFGQVVEGQDVVDAAAKVPAENERPKTPVVMTKVEILRVDEKGRLSGVGPKPEEKAPKPEAAPAPKKRAKKKSKGKAEETPKQDPPK